MTSSHNIENWNLREKFVVSEDVIRFGSEELYIDVVDEILPNLRVLDCDITLSSGRKSNFYIDIKGMFVRGCACYIVRDLKQLIRSIVCARYKRKAFHPWYVAGKGLGGICLVSAMTCGETDALPIFIRDLPKEYGIVDQVICNEGALVKDPKRGLVVLVDDVVTTGNTLRQANFLLRKKGIEVDFCVVVVNRGMVRYVDDLTVYSLINVVPVLGQNST